VVVALATLTPACQRTALPPPPASDLIPAGATPRAVRAGDLDGDGVEEIVVASVTQAAGETAFSTPHLEVFDHREGEWRRVFDAAGPAPPGPPGTPPTMLEDGQGFVAQSIEVLELVDFAGNGTPEVVTAIASFGATTGPVGLWILSMAPDGDMGTEFFRGTERGGEVTIQGNRVVFRFPVYRPDDPGCCPSRIEEQVIGLDGSTERIGVLERRRMNT
jgi:hypothetical protein